MSGRLRYLSRASTRPVRLASAVLGPLLWLACWLLIPEHVLAGEPRFVLGLTLWMATWWIGEAVPIPATALLPLLVLVPSGLLEPAGLYAAYADPIVFLFLGGFLLASAIQRWGLHHRIALVVLLLVGSSPRALVLGFMLATALLSAWISNTATAMLVIPIAVAVVSGLGTVDVHPDLDRAVLLGIGYAASIGGIATLIGTPPNAVLAGLAPELAGVEISFSSWMIVAMPLSLLLLGCGYLYLTRIAFRIVVSGDRDGSAAREDGARAVLRERLAELGPMRSSERTVLVVFGLVALGWLLRPFVEDALPFAVSDTTIALAGAMLLFVLPSRDADDGRLMDWQSTRDLPWGVLVLIGGGLSLAHAFATSGLAGELVGALGRLEGSSELTVLAAITGTAILLTEVASNTAGASTLVPVAASAAELLSMDPVVLMAGAAIGSACAFMMPVGTPPMALVYATGRFTIARMVRIGIGMNLIAWVVIAAYLAVFGRYIGGA